MVNIFEVGSLRHNLRRVENQVDVFLVYQILFQERNEKNLLWRDKRNADCGNYWITSTAMNRTALFAIVRTSGMHCTFHYRDIQYYHHEQKNYYKYNSIPHLYLTNIYNLCTRVK